MKRFLAICLFALTLFLFSCENTGVLSVGDDTDFEESIFVYETDGGIEGESTFDDLSQFLTPAPDDDGAHQKLVAHAGGAVYGFRLTNSLEALDNAYENGFRLIELDFERTSDGKYVLLHDWEPMAGRMLFEKRVFTLDEYLSADSFMGLTLMDLDMLLSWLSEHKDAYIITDAKCGNRPFLADLRQMSGELFHRFIPQAYSYEEYSMAKELGYGRIVLTLYQMGTGNEDELFSFAEREKPFAITVPMTFLSEKMISGLAGRGVYTYAHSVNDLSFYENWREYGLYGIYTDYFYPAKFPY